MPRKTDRLRAALKAAPRIFLNNGLRSAGRAVLLAMCAYPWVGKAPFEPAQPPAPTIPAPKAQHTRLSFAEAVERIAGTEEAQEMLSHFRAVQSKKESITDYPFIAELEKLTQTCDADEQALAIRHTLIGTLVKRGAALDTCTEDGLSALEWATTPEELEFLVRLGAKADPAARDESGRTPLHTCRSLILAAYLLDKGADIAAKDNVGCTPMDTCPSGDVAQYLGSLGAPVASECPEGLFYCGNALATQMRKLCEDEAALSQCLESWRQTAQSAHAEIPDQLASLQPEPTPFDDPWAGFDIPHIPVRVDIVLNTVSEDGVQAEEKHFSFCASGYVYTGQATITYSDGGTRDFPVQSGGWMSLYSIFVNKGICPMHSEARSGDYEPTNFPDTVCPEMEGASRISTRFGGYTVEGFAITPDNSVKDRTALMLHRKERLGSEGCISTGTEEWNEICAELEHAFKMGVLSLPLTVRYEGISPDPQRFPENATRSDVRFPYRIPRRSVRRRRVSR